MCRKTGNTCVQIVISNFFENKINNKSYLNVRKQMTDVKLNCYYYIAILKTI